MKKYKLLPLFIILTTFFSCNSNSEKKEADSEKTELIFDTDKYLDSLKLAEQTASGYSVKTLQGKLKFGELVNIYYQPLSQFISNTEKRAQKEMWTKEETKSKINSEKEIYQGGQITVKFKRKKTSLLTSSNIRVTIIIKDTKENEIFRKGGILNLEYTEWEWTYPINKKIEVPFIVYVVEELGDEPAKFEVIAIKK